MAAAWFWLPSVLGSTRALNICLTSCSCCPTAYGGRATIPWAAVREQPAGRQIVSGSALIPGVGSPIPGGRCLLPFQADPEGADWRRDRDRGPGRGQLPHARGSEQIGRAAGRDR